MYHCFMELLLLITLGGGREGDESEKNVGCLPICKDAILFTNTFLFKFIANGKGKLRYENLFH